MSILSFRKKPDSGTVVRNAERRLRESPYFFLKGIRCHFERGVLTLRGRVPLSPLKRFAESIVSRIDGVRKVVNQIEVYNPEVDGLSAPTGRSCERWPWPHAGRPAPH